MKAQIMIDDFKSKILRTNFCNGKTHDMKLLKESGIKISKKVVIIGDLGYLGLDKMYAKAFIPIKSSKNKPLTKKDKAYSKKISKIRIVIEHVFAKLKVFRIFAGKYRNKKESFEKRFNLWAGIYNYQLI